MCWDICAQLPSGAQCVASERMSGIVTNHWDVSTAGFVFGSLEIMLIFALSVRHLAHRRRAPHSTFASAFHSGFGGTGGWGGDSPYLALSPSLSDRRSPEVNVPLRLLRQGEVCDASNTQTATTSDCTSQEPGSHDFSPAFLTKAQCVRECYAADKYRIAPGIWCPAARVRSPGRQCGRSIADLMRQSRRPGSADSTVTPWPHSRRTLIVRARLRTTTYRQCTLR
ncbi:hypothetical protein BD414DRAFT_149795 [Trametes punicea]|nr:hypothetical protein BD414DRAFT_149795 [Trametes punicea]